MILSLVSEWKDRCVVLVPFSKERTLCCKDSSELMEAVVCRNSVFHVTASGWRNELKIIEILLL